MPYKRKINFDKIIDLFCRFNLLYRICFHNVNYWNRIFVKIGYTQLSYQMTFNYKKTLFALKIIFVDFGKVIYGNV